jgi:hypothetical protein
MSFIRNSFTSRSGYSTCKKRDGVFAKPEVLAVWKVDYEEIGSALSELNETENSDANPSRPSC